MLPSSGPAGHCSCLRLPVKRAVQLVLLLLLYFLLVHLSMQILHSSSVVLNLCRSLISLSTSALHEAAGMPGRPFPCRAAGLNGGLWSLRCWIWSLSDLDWADSVSFPISGWMDQLWEKENYHKFRNIFIRFFLFFLCFLTKYKLFVVAPPGGRLWLLRDETGADGNDG